MHAAALNVAERVDAESVGIYEMVDGELHGIGVCGPYPLVHGIDKPLLTPYEQLLDAMRRERYEAKSSLFGKLMKDQQRELVPDASVDPRFSEFPNSNTLRSVMLVPLISDGVLTGAIHGGLRGGQVHHAPHQSRPRAHAAQP